jgi:hypothetical protein
LSANKPDEAFSFFKQAADLFKQQGDLKQAAFCCASAAGCWSIKHGEKTFYCSAQTFQEGAAYSAAAGDFEYASLLYKYAALHYQRESEFISFSDCFYMYWDMQRKAVCGQTFTISRYQRLLKLPEFLPFLKDVSRCAVLSLSSVVWGHGERPFRTLFTVAALIFFSAMLYTAGAVTQNGNTFVPSFWQALYFSVITFTTVGYGDITPVSVTRFIAALEALGGITLMPLFFVGLTRKYLRM